MSQTIAPAGGMSLASEIAVMLIENEAHHAQTGQADRDAARERFLSDSEAQVKALHAAATATMYGALVGASLTAIGGACQIASATYDYDAKVGPLDGACAKNVAEAHENAAIYSALGKTSSELGPLLKGFVFDSTAGDRQADAKEAETRAEQARWQAQDASAEIDKAERQSNKVLDALQSFSQTQNTANTAIIGRI